MTAAYAGIWKRWDSQSWGSDSLYPQKGAVGFKLAAWDGVQGGKPPQTKLSMTTLQFDYPAVIINSGELQLFQSIFLTFNQNHQPAELSLIQSDPAWNSAYFNII